MENTLKTTEIVTIIEANGLDAVANKEIKERFENFFLTANEWKEKAFEIVVTDVTQKDLMKQAREARLLLKGIRTDADKVRKALKEDSIKYSKEYSVLDFILYSLGENVSSRSLSSSFYFHKFNSLLAILLL